MQFGRFLLVGNDKYQHWRFDHLFSDDRARCQFNYILTNVLGNTVGLFVAFILNKLWTFQHGGPWSPSLAKWLIVASFGYACNLGAVITAHRSLVMNSYIPQFVGVVAYTLVSFFGGRYFAFASAHK